ncbi:unnamed protein product, partial [Brenthis ino]
MKEATNEHRPEVPINGVSYVGHLRAVGSYNRHAVRPLQRGARNERDRRDNGASDACAPEAHLVALRHAYYTTILAVHCYL